MNVEIERADWINTPGRTMYVTLGPIRLWVGTTDGFELGFLIRIAPNLSWSWMVSSGPIAGLEEKE